LLQKKGYQVAAICGLLEYKEKGYPMIHPKAEPKAQK